MFADRTDAGERVADALADDVAADIVVGITRGGIPVARIVADRLDCPLGAVVVQKIGAPGREELALGAVTADGTAWLNDDLIDSLDIDDGTVAKRREQAVTTAREKAARYREQSRSLAGDRVVVVDDGVATGATAKAALTAAQDRDASAVVFAVPVAAPSALPALRERTDDVVAVETPDPFGSVGRHYDQFPQVTDEEVQAALG